MPRCLVVQHVRPEPPYVIGQALERQGVEVDLRQVFLGDPLPADLSHHQGLVVMGGPMSAHLDQGFPTRKAELALLAEGLEAGLPTLGVCLGSQLLAVAAGGEVFPGSAGPEIGWGPVTLATPAADDVLLGSFPAVVEVFHWHGDTFTAPPGALRLASNDAYPNQAFRVGDRAWGFQFHLEVDRAAVETMVAAFHSEAERVEGGAVAILAATESAVAGLASHRDRALTAFAELVAAQGDGTAALAGAGGGSLAPRQQSP